MKWMLILGIVFFSEFASAEVLPFRRRMVGLPPLRHAIFNPGPILPFRRQVLGFPGRKINWPGIFPIIQRPIFNRPIFPVLPFRRAVLGLPPLLASRGGSEFCFEGGGSCSPSFQPSFGEPQLAPTGPMSMGQGRGGCSTCGGGTVPMSQSSRGFLDPSVKIEIGSDNYGEEESCRATVVDREFGTCKAITAAHCLAKESQGRSQFTLSSLTVEGKEISSANAYVPSKNYDIAVIHWACTNDESYKIVPISTKAVHYGKVGYSTSGKEKLKPGQVLSNSNGTVVVSAKNTYKGESGSGMYKSENGKLTLRGVLSEANQSERHYSSGKALIFAQEKIKELNNASSGGDSLVTYQKKGSSHF